MDRVVLFKSDNRFDSFRSEILKRNVDLTILDFQEDSWLSFDFGEISAVIYYPTFRHSSNHPLALRWVYDNLSHIHMNYPSVKMFPDPRAIPFYSDKYRQFLFMHKNGIASPRTLPLESQLSVDRAVSELGFPLVVKNRYGAGGDFVQIVHSRRELTELLHFANMEFGIGRSASLLAKRLFSRRFLRALVGDRSAHYPFWSPPPLAQEFIEHDHDLKVVIGDGEAVEAHWRRQATSEMQKMNIDGGGIGEWSYVPLEAQSMCAELAEKIGAKWLNVDLLPSKSGYLVSEFSPVWHHYSYKEKASFVYKDDYNLKTPIEHYCDLERMICDSYMRHA